MLNFPAQSLRRRLTWFGLVSACLLALGFTAPATVGAVGTDGAWEKVLDANQSGFSKVFLGTLGDDLYMFGSAGESAGGMRGVWRYRDGRWTQLASLASEDFNGLLAYGAVAYKGKLYVGDRRAGNLYRLDLTCSGDFSALTPAAKGWLRRRLPGPDLERQAVAGNVRQSPRPR